MKKAKLHEIVTCILFCAFVAGMGIFYLVLPDASFSETEKRELADFPQITWENIKGGTFADDLETYMADHMPGRNFFVGLGAYYDLFTGQQGSKDIYRAEDDRLVEAPVRYDENQVIKNMKYIQRFADNLGAKVDFMLVPSAGFMLEESLKGNCKDYIDDEIIASIYAFAGDNITCFDLLSVYRAVENPGDLYYRTDHHWTSYGAYLTYAAYMESIGQAYPAMDYFTVERFDGFRGSTYSRSALWLTPAESVELWHGSDLLVENSSSEYPHPGAFYKDRLEEADMYTVYLDGNQPIVHIYNENNVGKGKLLVVRDSYANCLGSFLAESYEEVILVDLRYYHQSISQLVETQRVDRVLILYSLSNFMTDNNIPFLK